ncbi:MAG: hypothetical protein ACJAT5_000975 [Lentimonas sp.]|jgi:hypothetical protein
MNIFNSHSKERLFCDQGVVSKRSKIIAEPNLVAQARLGAPASCWRGRWDVRAVRDPQNSVSRSAIEQISIDPVYCLIVGLRISIPC